MPRSRLEIPEIKDCIKGRVYALRCRNLGIGVWNGKDGFIGIRYKFGSRYLFTEYHWDTGAPYGTVAGAKDLGIDVPDDIDIVEHYDTIDEISGRAMYYDKEIKNYRFTDTNEIAPPYPEVRAVLPANKNLFQFLDKVAKDFSEEDNDNV